MADKIFPWTEIVPEIEDEDDYIWSCVDTEITELPDIISWCYPGQFRSLVRIFIDISSDVEYQVSVGSLVDIGFNISDPVLTPGWDWETFTGDDFTGNDDDPPNLAVWTVQPEPKKPAKIKTNKLKYILDLDEEGDVHSKFKMTGEFSVQVSFDIISQTNLSFARLEFFNDLISPTNGGYIGIYFDGIKRFSSNYLEGGSWQSATTRARGDVYGGLRVTRTDTDLFSTFEKDGPDGFVNLKLNRQPPDDMYISLRAYGTGGGAITFTFDDFIINSGTPVSG